MRLSIDGLNMHACGYDDATAPVLLTCLYSMQQGMLCKLTVYSGNLQVQLITLQLHFKFTTYSIIPANAQRFYVWIDSIYACLA